MSTRLVVLAAITLSMGANADTLRKLSEVKDLEISDLSIVALFPNTGELDPTSPPASAFVTAVRDIDDRLRLLRWVVDAAGGAQVRANFATDGTIKEVAATEEQACIETTTGCFLTTVRDSKDALRVIKWDVDPGGDSYTRGGTAVGQQIREVAAGTIFGKDAFVAARDFDGDLWLSSYGVGTDIVVQWPGEKTFGGASRISVTNPSTNNKGFTVAMRDSQSKLRLINYRNRESLSPIQRGKGGEISDVRIAKNTRPNSAGSEAFTFSIDAGPSAVRTGASCLSGRRFIGHGRGKIIGWQLTNEIQEADLQRTRETQLTNFGGIAKKADLIVLRAGNRLVTGHLGFDNFCRALRRDQGKPRLQLTVWDTESRPDALVKVADAHLGGDYTDIAMTEIAGSGDRRRFAVALRGANGVLKVSVWGLELEQ